jgi:lysophospholipase L1-like esterase
MRTARALLLSLLVALALGEALLRIVGFRYELKAHVIEVQAPNREKVFDGYTLDPDLLWVRKNYNETLARALERPPDILFLGDSCTEFGDYDRRFVRLLREAGLPGARIPTTANFGCAGWSTFQGRRQMARDVVRVAPRVATIWYGWNDHWDSVGKDDAAIHRMSTEPIRRLRGLRLVQMLDKSRVALARAGRSTPAPRVAPADFEANLRALVASARGGGIRPVLLTAPTPGRPNEGRWTGDAARLIAAHRDYIDIVRRVAREERVPLCDLAAAFDRIPADTLRARHFVRDEVHLTDEGNEEIARLLVAFFQADTGGGGR